MGVEPERSPRENRPRGVKGSSMPRSTQPITVDQFVELVEDGQKADLLDGMICMASPDSRAAAEVNAFLTSLLCLFVQERGLGQIYGPRSAFRLAETYAPEPDLAFVPRDRLHLWEGAVFKGAPDLAIEIIAPDSVNRDTVVKRDVYERAGVDEYWMVNLLDARCTFLRLDGKTYRDVTPEAGALFRSEAVPGFWLDPAWLFAEELPNGLECLHRILG